jgi:hypothetical protein
LTIGDRPMAPGRGAFNHARDLVAAKGNGLG